ncbi:MAG: tol-pal system protein YbgF [Desulfobacteraceae bacterium]|nr:tol-pal system protein YbgF [Desulfobacteraceae bacterium]
MNRFFYFAVFFIFCLIFCSGCVASSKVGTLENRVIALEMENTRQIKKNIAQENIIKKLQKNSALSRKNYASVKSELRSLKATILSLKGIVEETDQKVAVLDNRKGNNANDKKIAILNNKILKLSQRIVELEHYIGLETSKTSPDQSPGPTLEKSVDNVNTEYDKENPEAIYKHAKSLLDQEKYGDSRLVFEEFISLFPDSKNADNARFWIADTYFREKWYEKSILEYQKVIENYSTGNKVAAALLKQGYSFAELGEKANARLILKELIKKYPESNEAKLAEKKLESLKK